MSMLPAIVVTGLGRCGSSMMMQMLAAGGVFCLGRAPAYEDPQYTQKVTPDLLEAAHGMAVKILDPHRVGLPAAKWEARVILMERRIGEQAKSAAKMMEQLEGLPIKKFHIHRLEKAMRAEYRDVRAAIAGLPQLHLQFEEVLADPAEAVRKVAEFLAPLWTLDQAAMAGVVLKREPACMPDLSIELQLAEAQS